MNQEPDIVRATDPVVPVIIVQRPVSVQPVIVREPEPQAPTLPGGQEPAPIIPTLIEAAKIFVRGGLPLSEQNNSGATAQTIPNNSGKSSERVPNNAQTIPSPAQNTPALQMPEIEEDGEVGRKRKYEETGIYGDISIKDVVMFRYIKKRHFPDLSKDMQDWYEHFYFTVPVEGEKPFRGRNYEQHKRAYDRGQRWFAAYDAAHSAATDGSLEAVGHSGATIVPFPRRANG